MDLCGIRVQGQRRLEMIGRVFLVVLLQKQQAGFQMGRPEVGIEFQSVGIQFGDQKLKLVAHAIPSGVLGRGQADPTQRFGRLDLMIVVILDQPAIGLGRLVELARHTEQLALNPTGKQLLRVRAKRRLHVTGGRRIVAAVERQQGQLGMQVGVFPGTGHERLDRLVQLSLGRMRSSEPQHASGRFRAGIDLPGLRILARVQQPACGRQIVVCPRHDRPGPDAQQTDRPDALHGIPGRNSPARCY